MYDFHIVNDKGDRAEASHSQGDRAEENQRQGGMSKT